MQNGIRSITGNNRREEVTSYGGMMNILVLSGGSGKRLWPLSNITRSKQFLKVLTNDEGKKESMLQRIHRQIRKEYADGTVIVAAPDSQRDSIYNQIGKNTELVIEPESRNTYPAIALSCAYLHEYKNLSLEDIVIVMPVDPYAEEGYFKAFADMKTEAEKGNADLVLMGIKPTYPSAKYGYILCEKTGENQAIRFVEKPSEEDAEKWIAQGAWWNAGVFAFRIGFLKEIVEKDGMKFTYAYLLEHFKEMEAISFDYKVTEKTKRLSMIPYNGIWKDLGTWNTLTEEMKEENSGNARQGEGCTNTHVINELDIPVVVLGTHDLLVAASPDGVLVSDKHKSSYLKPYVEEVESRPMYEERRWGEYKVLDYVQYDDNTRSLTKHLTIQKGKSISYQLHKQRDEIWTIVDGSGELLVDGKLRKVGRGDVAYITKGQKHAMRAITNLHFIEVQIGKELSEEDIERFEWEWE